MSSNVVESPPPLTERQPPGSAPRARPVRGGRAAAAAAAPAAVALGAWLLHFYAPDGQTPPMDWLDKLPPWRHPYPLVLAAVAALSLLLTAAQWAWRPLRPWTAHYGPLVAGAAVVAAFWDLITLKLNWLILPYFPGPDAVLGGLFADRAALLLHVCYSFCHLLVGYSAGVAAGLTSGVLIGWFPRVRYWGMPALKLVGPIPATALVPLAMILSDYAFVSAALLIAFAVWFPVTMLTASGISNVRLSYLDVARTLGAGRFYLIFRVAIPAAMPMIFIGLFMGLGASFLSLVAAETVGVDGGLAWYIDLQRGGSDYYRVYGALLLMAVFFSALMTLLFKVRDVMLKWQKGVIKW